MDSNDQNLNLNFESLQLNENSRDSAGVRGYLEIFILSEFGKPIYCHNKRDDQITLLPLCQALVNYFNDTQSDTLKYVLLKSGLRITFAVKSPLIIVVINHQYSGLDASLIINQIYAQIISTVTNKTLKSVYEQSATFDLRRLLGNSEKMIEYLVENGLVAKQLRNLTTKLAKQSDKSSDKSDKASDRTSDRISDRTGDRASNRSNGSSLSENQFSETDEVYCFLTSITQSYSNAVRQNALAITSSSSSNLTSNVYKPNSQRVMIPVLPLAQSLRDSITNILTSSIASSSADILYSILVQFDNDLISEEDRPLQAGNESTAGDNSTANPVNGPEASRAEASGTEASRPEAVRTEDSNEPTIPSKKESDQEETSEENGTEENDKNEPNRTATQAESIKISDFSELSDELSEELLIKEELKPTANCHLITIANQNPKVAKMNTLDAHIVQNLILVLKNQLNTVESLWLPVCLPRFNNNAFMHGHFCLLSLPVEEGVKSRCGLIQLTTNKEDFDKCQIAKNIIAERLAKLTISPVPFSEIGISILHAFWYQSLRSQSVVWKSKYCQNRILCKNDYLIHYMAKRMIDSNLKTFWLRSDRHYIALLGWHSPTFQLYVQFDVIATKAIAVNAAQSIMKWIKKEEEKILIKDYQ